MFHSSFETEGPFGVPMKAAQAKLLEQRLKEVPRDEAFAFRRASWPRGLSEWQPEGRCDVSWITEESPDRAGDVVRAAGMDESSFILNPLVTLNHNYAEPPVGRSLWRKRIKEGTLVGVKAKTHYPVRPASWSAGPWPPDVAFDLVQSGLLLGKSIGFVPLQLREPTGPERREQSGWDKVRYVIEKWLLVEYACCFVPMQPNAVVEEVLKGARSRGITPPPTETVTAALAKLLARPDVDEIFEKMLQRVLHRCRSI